MIPSNSVSSFDVQKQNDAVKRWAPKVKRRLKNSARMFTSGKKESFVTRPGRTEGKLADSITAKVGKNLGVSDFVSFAFERHGVFVHKGVGSGWEIAGSGVSHTAKHPSGITRKPAHWFNPVLEQQIPILADSIAVINANAVLNAVKLHIK